MLRFGKRTLESPTDDQRAQVQALGDAFDLEQLDKLLDGLANATSWSDLLSKSTAPRQAPPAPNYLLPIEFDPTRIGSSIDQYASVSMRAGEKAIIHLRFQRMYQSGLGEVLYKESLRLRDKYQCQPITLLTLLWPGADGLRDITGEFPQWKRSVSLSSHATVGRRTSRNCSAIPEWRFLHPLSRFALDAIAGGDPPHIPGYFRSSREG